MQITRRVATCAACTLLFVRCSLALAQDERAQYPRLLSNSYIGLQAGYIDYPFSNSQLQAGLNAQSIGVPHLAVRALLMGHEFSRNLAAQISYLRPVEWVRYQNVGGDRSSHSVWMNVAGLTAKWRQPLTGALSVYGEGGLGLITRKGFEVNGAEAVKNANYASVLLGAGVQYRLNPKWDLLAGTTFTPAHAQPSQPRIAFVSAGFTYTMRPLTTEQVERNAGAGVGFPRSVLQLGYITAALGYGVNDFVSKGPVPVFWAADVRVSGGVSLNYQRNVFHTRRVFSLDWGGGISSLKSEMKSGKGGERVFTAAVYPLLRFTALRTRPADLYFNYSLAGPAFISRTAIDGEATGRHFTFQDFMGAGVFVGRNRTLNAEVRIMHYSNGNLFPQNPGVTVPLAFNIGYAR